MTTGRINQVTIVSQGLAYQDPRGALERFVTDRHSLKSAPAVAPAAGPPTPRRAIHLPPLSSPGHPSTTLKPLKASAA